MTASSDLALRRIREEQLKLTRKQFADLLVPDWVLRKADQIVRTAEEIGAPVRPSFRFVELLENGRARWPSLACRRVLTKACGLPVESLRFTDPRPGHNAPLNDAVPEKGLGDFDLARLLAVIRETVKGWLDENIMPLPRFRSVCARFPTATKKICGPLTEERTPVTKLALEIWLDQDDSDRQRSSAEVSSALARFAADLARHGWEEGGGRIWDDHNRNQIGFWRIHGPRADDQTTGKG